MIDKQVKIELPKDVNYIIDTFTKNNYECYLVGGSLRDYLLKRNVHDYDLTTSALPSETISLFDHVFLTGLKHGTVSILLNKEIYEVTTFRIDGTYLDNRHPSDVTFTRSLDEDLKRRDFTINALAYNPSVGLIDLFNGINDLNNKIIRCVNNPNKRFKEDALRMLRAIRFSSELNFIIEENTYKAIKECAPLIQNISKERIRDEFNKTLLSDNPYLLKEFYDTNLSTYFFNELSYIYENNLEEKLNNELNNSEKDLTTRLVILFSYLDKSSDFRKILNNFKLPNEIIKNVLKIYNSLEFEIKDNESLIRKEVSILGISNYKKLLNILKNKENDEEINLVINKFDTYNLNGLTLKELKVNGSDLLKLNYKNIEIGNILNNMLIDVISDPSKNNKEYLLNHIKEYQNNEGIK